ncbi:MAG: hypothetical protein AB1Z19_08210 [Eubacteriales bacterium]
MKTIRLILVLMVVLLIAGCASTSSVELTDEVIATFPVYDEAELASASNSPTSTSDLAEKFETIGFVMVSGQYTRNVTEDDITLTEMFALDKTNFIRIAFDDMEQEVFAYNYTTDDFTYLYYFDGELMTKTKIHVDTGAVLEDEAGYADLLTTDAEALKVYFNALIDDAGLTISDLTS